MLTAVQCKRAAGLLRDNMTEPGDGALAQTREERREPVDVWELIDALKAQNIMIDGVEALPASVVTLKTPANGNQRVWVAETPRNVRSRVQDARAFPNSDTENMQGPLIRLTVVRGFKGFDLWTRHDNISSVEDYR